MVKVVGIHIQRRSRTGVWVDRAVGSIAIIIQEYKQMRATAFQLSPGSIERETSRADR